MSNVIEDIVHELIDVVSGRQASLPPARAAELHEAVTPGYTDEPMSQEDTDRLEALQARQERIAAKKAADAEAAAAAEAAPVQSSDAG